MKNIRVLIYLLFSFSLPLIYAQQDKALLEEMLKANRISYPFDFTKRTEFKAVQIPASLNKLQECNIYNDIRRYSLKEKVSAFRVLGKFNLLKTNHVFLVEFGDPAKERRQFLWVMDKEGKLLSSLDVGYGYGPNLITKQFSVWSDKKIIVNQIYSYGSDTVRYQNLNSFTGGRIDTQFKIEESGQIKTTGARAYYGRKYDRKEMENRFYEIGEGSEKERKNDRMYSSSDQFLDIDSLAFSADSVDTPPQFSGGDEALKSYVADNLKRLKADKEFISIGGEVVVSFITNEEGHICNIRIERGLNDRFDYFAKELILHMPQWIPAVHDGKKVPVKVTLPLLIPII